MPKQLLRSFLRDIKGVLYRPLLTPKILPTMCCPSKQSIDALQLVIQELSIFKEFLFSSQTMMNSSFDNIFIFSAHHS
jgi:hypothetical protein